MDLHPRVQQILALKWKGPLSQKEWAQSLPKCVGPKLRMYTPKNVPCEIKLKLYHFRNFVPLKYVPLQEMCTLKICIPPENMYHFRKCIPPCKNIPLQEISIPKFIISLLEFCTTSGNLYPQNIYPCCKFVHQNEISPVVRIYCWILTLMYIAP